MSYNKSFVTCIAEMNMPFSDVLESSSGPAEPSVIHRMYFVAPSDNQIYLVLFSGQTVLQAASEAAVAAGGVSSFGLDGTEKKRIINPLYEYNYTMSYDYSKIPKSCVLALSYNQSCDPLGFGFL